MLTAGHITDTRRCVVTVLPMERRAHTRNGTVITMYYDRQVVGKNHPDSVKLQDEVDWYRLLPVDLRDLAPDVVGSGLGTHGYEMTLVPGPTLAESRVFAARSWAFWKTALDSLGTALDRLHGHKRQDAHDPTGAQRIMYVDKTLERIALLRPAKNVTLPTSLWTGPHLNGRCIPGLELVEETLAATYLRSGLATPRAQTLIHGDFHLGNLFYAADTRTVTMIDPRGSFAGRRGTHGDPAYDDLKLGHSIIGGYDRVIFGSVRARRTADDVFTMNHSPTDASSTDRNSAEWLAERVRRTYGLTEHDLRLGISVLLLSLAALHADPNQQTSHLLRGLELYGEVL